MHFVPGVTACAEPKEAITFRANVDGFENNESNRVPHRLAEWGVWIVDASGH